MLKKISIIIADDHPLVRKGLRDIIQEQDDFSIIGEAEDGEQAVEMIEKLFPTVAIIDINMPKMSGLEAIKSIQQKNLNVHLIILTMHEKENFFNRAMDLGIKGYILKDSALSEIVDAIRNVSEGKYFISSSISGFLVKKSQLMESSAFEDKFGIYKLTTTERKILRLIANNKTTNDIAEELFLSVYTVQTHRSHICQKLNLHGPNALLHFVLDHSEFI
jgi:DNA-binding NarL/FixJ family response regulator